MKSYAAGALAVFFLLAVSASWIIESKKSPVQLSAPSAAEKYVPQAADEYCLIFNTELTVFQGTIGEVAVFRGPNGGSNPVIGNTSIAAIVGRQGAYEDEVFFVAGLAVGTTTFSLVDNQTGEICAQIPVYVLPPPPPETFRPSGVADTNTPLIPAGGTANLDGALSYDNDTIGPEPLIVEYRWTLANLTNPNQPMIVVPPSTEPVVPVILTIPGEYEATLVVKDNDGELSDPAVDQSQAHVTIKAVGVSFNPSPIQVAVNATQTVTATIVPASALADVTFHIADTAKAGVTPQKLTATPGKLTVNGKAEGATKLLAEITTSFGSQSVGEDDITVVPIADDVIDIEISDGQDAPNPVPEDKEETRGAFTAANLNDTDGDGIIDNEDPTVFAAHSTIKEIAKAGSIEIVVADPSGFKEGDRIAVGKDEFRQVRDIKKIGGNIFKLDKKLDNPLSANDPVEHSGRNEIDLMRLRIKKPQGDPEKEVAITIIKGAIKLWKNSTKEVEETARTFKVSELPKDLWIEAIKPSTEIRDIVIEATFNQAKDIVKATAIWGEYVISYHDNTNAEDLLKLATLKDLTDPPKTLLTEHGGVGLLPEGLGRGPRNGILMTFRVSPPGVGKEPGIRFDLTRQRQEVNFVQPKKTDPIEIGQYVAFPDKEELPNDDPGPGEGDESASPTDSNQMYVYDQPGFISDRAFHEKWVRRHNMLQWLRVRYDSVKPSGDQISGSRCCTKFPWHSVMTILKGPGDLVVREGGNDRQTKDNEVAPELISNSKFVELPKKEK